MLPTVSVPLEPLLYMVYIASLKTVRWDLKPAVLTFAMLLPITFILLMWVFRPAIAAYIAPVI